MARQKSWRVVDNRLLAPVGVVSVALRWEPSPPENPEPARTPSVYLRKHRGPLCTQVVDDGVDERRQPRTNRA